MLPGWHYPLAGLALLLDVLLARGLAVRAVVLHGWCLALLLPHSTHV